MSEFWKLSYLVPSLTDNLYRDLTFRELIRIYETESTQRRDSFAPTLWFTPCIMTVLIQELANAYRLVCGDQLTNELTDRLCNVLTLFQMVAGHYSIKRLYLQSKMHLYMLPFLDNKLTGRNHEELRASALRVITALVKASTFIVQHILANEEGLQHCCAQTNRFIYLAKSLRQVVLGFDRAAARHEIWELLRFVIGCYHKLSADPRTVPGLQRYFPVILSHSYFSQLFQNDANTLQQLHQLLEIAAPL
ncbi:cell differentiation protein rcd1-like isoform X3 [Mercurialis annua]|uniref:cell differentiation protein rcd1-like isoform X3 n=1 Tax=Mercurialis annua TaxID=3986 RepID=UPI00215FC533|nr:cell differentiation protein rcd1-like isoform X3 [Mercurialis annua]